MKVLWFSNTAANADEYFNSELKGGGGWLKALDQSLQKYVEMHIAFYNQYDRPFKYKETFYHPIKINNSIFNRALNRFISYVQDEDDLSKYLEIIDKVKPDIIHIHGTENSFGCIVRYTNIPVVVSIQGIITAISHKYCNGFENSFLHVRNKRWTSIKDYFFPWTFYNEYRLFQKLQKLEIKNLKTVKNIMGRTDWDKRVTRLMAPNSTYYQDDRILRNSFYHHQWFQHKRNKIIIYTTNGNNFYKGFETLCMALNELNKIGIKCEWHVAGINPRDLIVKITKLKLKDNYPQKGLVLQGSINEQTLIENLLNSDIYVMTSHIENNANNLYEAMMLGMPCISTFVGGIGSIIKDGKEGILIQNGDPWSMAGAILELINNPEKAALLGENARSVALKRHDKDRIVKEILKTYEKIIKKEIQN